MIMGLFIVFFIGFVVGILLLFIGDAYSDFSALVGIILTVFSSAAIIVMLLLSLSLPEDFAYVEERYKNLKSQIECISSDDVVTGENLRNQVLEMNNEISKHRCYCGNIWIGMWYSERVGSLEMLEWKSGKLKDE